MEKQKAILKFFKTLSEEQNEDVTQGDTELSFNLKKNGDMRFEDALESGRDSLLYVILPLEEEEITSNPAGRLTTREEGNDSEMTEEERNDVNLTERQHEAANDENVSESCCDSGGSVSSDECSLKESRQAECQHVSTECTGNDCDLVTPMGVEEDDSEEANQSTGKDSHHCQDDFIIPDSDLGADPEKSAKGRPPETEHDVMTTTQTGAGVEAQTCVGPPCFKNDDEEEKSCAEEENEEEEDEERDVFPDSSTQLPFPSIPKDTNIVITAAAHNPPTGSTFTRATFSPGSPADKQVQLPALFSAMRVLRKGVVGPEHDTVAPIRRDVSPEKQGDAKVQGGFLEQISLLLSKDKKEAGAEEDEDDTREKGEEGEECESQEAQTEEEAEVSNEPRKPSVSSAEAAFDAFKAFFTPKPLKKDPADKVDLEAVRKKIRADKDALRALFDRTANKTPEKKDSPDFKVRMCIRHQTVISCYLLGLPEPFLYHYPLCEDVVARFKIHSVTNQLPNCFFSLPVRNINPWRGRGKNPRSSSRRLAAT